MSIALAADTVSITIVEAGDNAFVALIRGALHGLGHWIMWAAVLGGFVIAFPCAFLANRAMIKRGQGHAHVPLVPPVARPQPQTPSRVSGGAR